MKTFTVPFIKTLFPGIRLADMLDIAIIAVCLYGVLLLVKQRAPRSVSVGIISTICLYVLARLLDMYLTLQLFQAGLAAILVALVLIFQEDIRRVFARLATWQPYRSKSSITASQMPDTLLESIAMLAHHKIGALVVLKGREVLERHTHGGVTVNGDISLPLLYSIFHPQSPGHDGAVLIEGSRIEKLGVHLPLSTNLDRIGLAGTRHAAALGLAERSDALVIVVSEERGTVSIAEHGKIDTIDSLAVLKEHLQGFYQQMSPSSAKSVNFSWVTHNLGTKLAALTLASLLWLLVAYRHTETVQRLFTVPIEYRNLAPNMTIDDPRPTEAQVTLSGQEKAFRFDPSTLLISLDLSDMQEGFREVVITEENLQRPPNLMVHRIKPQVVRLRAQQMIETTLPVNIPLQGYLPAHLKLLGVRPEPARVPVRIQRSRHRDVTELRTEPLRLDKVSKSTTMPLKLILPDYVRLLDGGMASIRVTVGVAEQDRRNPENRP